MKLIHSPDDNGYYWQRFCDWAVSQLFISREVAISAKNNNDLVWEQG